MWPMEGAYCEGLSSSFRCFIYISISSDFLGTVFFAVFKACLKSDMDTATRIFPYREASAYLESSEAASKCAPAWMASPDSKRSPAYSKCAFASRPPESKYAPYSAIASLFYPPPQEPAPKPSLHPEVPVLERVSLHRNICRRLSAPIGRSLKIF